MRKFKTTDLIALVIGILITVWIGWPGLVAYVLGCLVTVYHVHAIAHVIEKKG